jgi:hypothetical protein
MTIAVIMGWFLGAYLLVVNGAMSLGDATIAFLGLAAFTLLVGTWRSCELYQGRPFILRVPYERLVQRYDWIPVCLRIARNLLVALAILFAGWYGVYLYYVRDAGGDPLPLLLLLILTAFVVSIVRINIRDALGRTRRRMMVM